MLDAYRRRGRWISMVHDFNFKIMHRVRSKHANVNALSKIQVNEDEYFKKEIEDCEWMQHVHKEEETCWVA